MGLSQFLQIGETAEILQVPDSHNGLGHLHGKAGPDWTVSPYRRAVVWSRCSVAAHKGLFVPFSWGTDRGLFFLYDQGLGFDIPFADLYDADLFQYPEPDHADQHGYGRYRPR